MMRLQSHTQVERRPRTEVGLTHCLGACILWLVAQHGLLAQTPTTLTPPRSSVDQLNPPKTVPSTLLPPRTQVTPVAPPKSTTVTNMVPPPLQGQLTSVAAPPAASTVSPNELQQLAPAIAAVRTQLEILQPPPPPVQSRPTTATANVIPQAPPSSSGLTLEGPEVVQSQSTRQSFEIAPNSRVATVVPPVKPFLPTPNFAPVQITGNSDPRSLQPPPAQNNAITSTVFMPRPSGPQSIAQAPVATLQPPAVRPTALQPPPQVQLQPLQTQSLQAQSPAIPSPGQPATTQYPIQSRTAQILPAPQALTAPPAEVAPQTLPAPQSVLIPPAAAGSNVAVLAPPAVQVQLAQPQVAPTIEPPTATIVTGASPVVFDQGVTASIQVETPGQSILNNQLPAGAEAIWQFNFQNAPWPLVIRSFAKQNGFALQMLAEPAGQFNFVDERPYAASEALDLLNDYLLNEGFLLIRNNAKLTVVSAGAPVQEGIVPFVPMRQIDQLGRNELASVAIPIKSTDAPMVMSEIQPLLSRIGRAQVVSNSSRLVVTDTGAYLRRARDIIGGYGLAAGDLQTVVVHLKNTTSENMAATISAHLGISIGATSVTTAAGQSGVGSVIQASSVSATASGLSSTRVIADRETNSLLLSGTPAEVAEIQSLICQLDQARAQVILQGLILEVNLGNVNELGAEVGLQDSVLFNRSVIDNLVTLQQTNTAPNGVQTTSQQVVSQTSAPGFNFNNQALGNNTAISPNVLGAQGLGNLGVGRSNSQLGFGGLVLSASSNSVSLLLRALQANYQVDVLSRPQIRTVDNKEAFIQIGQQVPVVDGVNVTAVGTANPIIRQDQAGIILKMTPNVSPDGLIQIKVSAEKSAFKLQPGTGVPIFTDARNGTVIQAPIKDITTAQATVSARAGQTIVLGGMITRDEETIERRVPGLSRIPLLGRLFRYDYNNIARKELLIFLTPHIIADDASSDAYKDSEVNRIHAPLERAAEIHGQLLTNPPEDQAIIDQVITSD